MTRRVASRRRGCITVALRAIDFPVVDERRTMTERDPETQNDVAHWATLRPQLFAIDGVSRRR